MGVRLESILSQVKNKHKRRSWAAEHEWGATYNWYKNNPFGKIYNTPHLTLYFAGGESTIIEEHYIIRKVIEMGYASIMSVITVTVSNYLIDYLNYGINSNV